ncbi:MAG: tRNA (N6-isopentenyl adenosine(37)-C2)-methylthiotransferase MiaB [Bdellovibrionales bacterium]|nr:tRNA (N6-isopentenyl adenosine(37)-C2)-methylthiotransferase MiaB [Bdellovibrionales bacterium]
MDDSELVQIGGDRTSGKGSAAGHKALYIKTFGCQMNVYDSEKLERILDGSYSAVTDPSQADLILINTCSVRDKPEQKLYSMLGEYSGLKEKNPNLLVGVGGCVAQQEGENIVKRSKVVDFVFGTHNLSLVPSLIERRQQGAPPQVAIDYRDEWEDLPLGLSDKSRVSAFVSISRGCNKNCTYCIVPTTRGPEVSRDPIEIEREVKIAVRRGAREIVLLGQTVNSYGRDLSPRLKFTELMDRLSQIDDVERIRFTSPHPQEVRQDFYDLVASNAKVCKHIHMPLQSGSDEILKAMNRNYRRKRYIDIIDGLKAACPEIAITTDIIVGFPGETDQDFEDTMELLEYVRFINSYSFMFSPRPGTAAEALPNQLSHELKLERLQRYQARQSEITTEYLESVVGQQAELLLDGPSASDPQRLMGRTSQNVVVNLTENYEDLEPGMLVHVELTGAARYTLKARVLA